MKWKNDLRRLLQAYENPDTRDAAFEDLLCMANCADAYQLALLDSPKPRELIKLAVVAGEAGAAR